KDQVMLAFFEDRDDLIFILGIAPVRLNALLAQVAVQRGIGSLQDQRLFELTVEKAYTVDFCHRLLLRYDHGGRRLGGGACVVKKIERAQAARAPSVQSRTF